ncbi:MAG: hypothetical protein ABI835_18670, partial [Chloroflexota bacterium]
GAAGGSNPIYNVDGTNITGVQPYSTSAGVSGPALDPIAGTGPDASVPAGYGFFGLCPYGTEARFTDLTTSVRTLPQLLQNNNFPFCSDLRPDIRHFCGALASPASPDKVLDEDDFTQANRCIDFYDVDDYARDWADYVAIAELPGSIGGGGTGRVSDQLLPTVFTIGFGINYGGTLDGTGVNCSTYTGADFDSCVRGDPAFQGGSGDSGTLRRERTADYMGEELLRYIADVGDNFQIDSDYWQLCASETDGTIPQTAPCLLSGFGNTENRINNFIYLNSTSPVWGVRGPCEQADWGSVDPYDRGDLYLPNAPGESCGNYFAAPSGNELQVVFNQIASRMFTRLSQ